MSTKFSKEDLKKPDQVTQTLRQGFVWTTGHSKMVITAVSVFIVVGLGISLAGYFNSKKETTEQEKYFSLEKSYTEKKRGFDESAHVAMTPPGKDKKAPVVDPSKKATGDLTKDYGTIVEGFEAVVNGAPNSKAAQMAALNLSDIYTSYKKNDEALAALLKVESGLSHGDALTALVLMAEGNALSNKGDCKGAIEKWNRIVTSKTLEFAQDEAKVRSGLCFEALNDSSKAEQLYTEVAKKENANVSDSAAAHDAAKYLRLLKAKQSL